ncbi:MAG: VanZ family protein [Flavobacteriales bacterium]
MFLKSNYKGILITLVVAFLCLYPFQSQNESTIPHFDKVIHVTLFLVLSYFWMRGLSAQNQFKKLQEKAVLITVISAITYGVLIEVLQEVMHLGRSFDTLDIVADIVGVIFGFGIYRVVKD